MSILRWLVFNYWYFSKPPWDTGVSPPELNRFIESHPPGRALDLGCGVGTNVIYMARYGWQVIGVDFAILAIHNARRRASQAGVEAEFRVADVTRALQLPGPFDLILDMGCYHGLNQAGRQIYRSNIKNWLSPTGIYLAYVFIQDKNQTGQPGLNEADLTEIQSQFTIIEQINGTERGDRPSAWLTMEHKKLPT